MDVGTVHGTIDRRMLVNYQVDPDVLATILPPPFQPKLIHGVGIAGVCLIRFSHMSPRFVPSTFGLSSENAAHRIAVEWEQDGVIHEGVYIPRRDTSSRLNRFVGGRFFPGLYNLAHFDVVEHDDSYHIALDSVDHKTHLLVEAQLASTLPDSSVFASLSEASAFFEKGSLGYSATEQTGCYDALELRTHDWKVTPLTVGKMESSFFEDRSLFPADSIKFDCALVMQNVKHEWHSHGRVSQSTAANPNPVAELS
jgi:hypothetical protein